MLWQIRLCQGQFATVAASRNQTYWTAIREAHAGQTPGQKRALWPPSASVLKAFAET